MLIWNIKRLYKKKFLIKDGKLNKQKIRFFLYSITTGLILSLFFIYIFSEEPFSILFDGIKNTFKTDLRINNMIEKMVLLGLAGMAVGVGFKTGIFNIGVSGQMIAGAMTAGLFAINMGSKIPNGLGQFLIVLISIIIGSSVAGFSGILKAYFKIHEVVSTILMNWIAFYFMKWMLDPNTSIILDETNNQSKDILPNYLLRIDDNSLWPIVIILLTTAFLLWVFIYKTRYGMIFKMTGLNPDASNLSGVNTKLVMFQSMALSGAISGLLGAVLYFGINNYFDVPKADVIRNEGFDGIAIAIISYSNPIAIIAVSLFFSLVQSGIINTAGAINTNFFSLILGFLMYISAINKVFIYLDWKNIIRKLFYSREKNKLYQIYLKDKEQIDSNWYDKYNITRSEKINKSILKKKIAKIIDKHHIEIRNLKENYINQKKKIIIKAGKK